jgi:pyridoxamine 5'-phosphate oxidase
MPNPIKNPQRLANLRKDYAQASLDLPDVDTDPIHQFERWFQEAMNAEVLEPNAMTLCTIDPDGRPSARIVLIKGIDQRGLTFFTNYLSRKGKALEKHPQASVVFFWPELERQIRIEGRVEKVSAAESDEYFQSRPIKSKLGAWASPQSEVIPNREWLELRQKNLETTFPAESSVEPPRPEHWGGYRLLPDQFEFWQGRRSRLHDRLHYQRQGRLDREPAQWTIERLAP